MYEGDKCSSHVCSSQRLQQNRQISIISYTWDV